MALCFRIQVVSFERIERRLPMLEVAVHYCQPDLAILDGVRDQVADINDGITVQDCIERLMAHGASCSYRSDQETGDDSDDKICNFPL